MASGWARIAAGAGRLFLLLASLSACGGKYEDPGQQPNTVTPTPGGSASSKPSNGSPGSLPTHPLDECVRGFERNADPTGACTWITEKGECFDSFDGACACICPASGNSLCSAGFSPGVNGATTVYCDEA